ncbi:ABC transporter ATP-binding protein [Clostridium sp. AM58-1XD]|uniref:ABC transporter ATP-binding protein n=1 Tax=Clostridium sp. AM58-1XD TaxID=2292307 RepID=UPI000E503253|nr:ABC transporter ATP-binding protein [Clostridium sp. AM58-1XD]RGZ00635.1 ABC transporter ATP-binding protein [Clostridium sp. AM58-1XD]
MEKQFDEKWKLNNRLKEDVLLAVQNLTVRFPSGAGETEAVRSADFFVKKGEAVAIVGESGSGKTSLMRACMGLSGTGTVAEGTILFDFGQDKGMEDILHMGKKERRKRVYGHRIVMLFQDPAVCLNPTMTIGSQLTEGLRLGRKIGKKAALEEAAHLVEEAGMDGSGRILASYPHQLSGGMRQRIAMLLAMIPKPDLLICDELSSSLDSMTRRQVFELVEQERRKREMAVIYVTHDLDLAARNADYVEVMYDGKIVESGAPSRLFKNPKHAYTKKLLAAAGEIREAPKLKLREAASGSPLLEVDGLQQYFGGKKGGGVKAVDGVSFRIWPGEIYGLVGQSGAGKSTIGRIIMHIHEPVKGTILFDGKDYSGRLTMNKKRELYSQVQMIFQDPAACLNPARRIIDIVAQALDILPGKMNNEERERRVSQTLEAVGLSDEILYRYPHQLSGGQRQRVGIARTIIGNPRLVIVDEAVSALDPLVQFQVAGLLKEIQERTGMAMLFISHDLNVVRRICGRIGVMCSGKIVEEGRTEEIFEHPSHEYTRMLLNAAHGYERKKERMEP